MDNRKHARTKNNVAMVANSNPPITARPAARSARHLRQSNRQQANADHIAAPS